MPTIHRARFAGYVLNGLMLLCLPACGKKETSSLVGDAPSVSATAPASAPQPDTSAALAQSLALRQLERDALELMKSYQPEKAKEKLLELQKLSPEREGLKEALTQIDEMLSHLVAGRWFSQQSKDTMTGQENVSMTLTATEEIPGHYGNILPHMTVRCVKGNIDILIDAASVIDSDIYGNAKGQYRFNDEAIQNVKFTRSQDMKALFFSEPTTWIDRFIQHSDGRFLVDIPLFGVTPQAATFALAGADKALPQVKEACSKKK